VPPLPINCGTRTDGRPHEAHEGHEDKLVSSCAL
jgi:hypothetical protein